MEIRIKSIHFDATEKLQEFINKKVEKLQKSYEDIQKVEVQLKVEKPAAALNKPTSLTVTAYLCSRFPTDSLNGQAAAKITSVWVVSRVAKWGRL